MIKKRGTENLLRTLSTCVLLAVLFSVTSTTTFASTFRTVALTTDPVPGVTGATFQMNGVHPILNNTGQVAFTAGLVGTSISTARDTGVWSEGTGALSLIAQEGDPAPGGAGDQFSAFKWNELHLNNAGQLAFMAKLTGSGVTIGNEDGIWSEGGGSGLALVARAGDTAPGSSGATFDNFLNNFGIVFNDTGHVAFESRLTGTTVTSVNEHGIWTEAGGSGLAVLTRTGNTAPGVSGAVISKFPIVDSLAYNDGGQSTFVANLSGSGITSASDSSIWKTTATGGMTIISREGDAAPGASGALFADMTHPTIDNSGRVAFQAFLTGTGVTTSNDQGIWHDDAGSLTLIAREGDTAPGTSGATFGLLKGPTLCDNGHMVFTAALTGTGVTSSNDAGIWKNDAGGGGLSLVAREGDAAPGTSNAEFKLLLGPALNNAGQSAFMSLLSGSGVTSGVNDFGIWAEDPDGILTKIARTGDLLDVDDGPGTDLRTITSLGFTTDFGKNGSQSGLNDVGQIAFRATFADGSSGVFVSNLTTVPEPGLLMVSWMSAIVLLALDRKRRARSA